METNENISYKWRGFGELSKIHERAEVIKELLNSFLLENNIIIERNNFNDSFIIYDVKTKEVYKTEATSLPIDKDNYLSYRGVLVSDSKIGLNGDLFLDTIEWSLLSEDFKRFVTYKLLKNDLLLSNKIPNETYLDTELFEKTVREEFKMFLRNNKHIESSWRFYFNLWEDLVSDYKEYLKNK